MTYHSGNILAPTSLEIFERDYFEKSPLIVHRGDPLYYEDLLTLAGIDEILSTSDIHPSRVRVVQNGHDHPLNSAGSHGLEELYARYRDGSTIVLQSVHERWQPVAELCASLSASFSARLQANAYLTPPHSQGLGLHYDTHDVLVLQLHGQKRWRLSDSAMRLPLPGQRYQGVAAPDEASVRELSLDAGDAIYLPRGYAHEAETLSSASVHLTVGIIPITWAEVILASIESLVEGDSRFRESLPPGFARSAAIAGQAQEHFAELLTALSAEIDPQAAMKYASERAWLAERPLLDGHLLDLHKASSIASTTLVQRRPLSRWSLSIRDSFVYVQFHGKVLQMPEFVAADLLFIGDLDGPFDASALPGELDEEGRLVLIRRLLREGFLTIS